MITPADRERREPTGIALRMLVTEIDRLSNLRGLNGSEQSAYRNLHDSFRKVANQFYPHPDTCDHAYGLITYVKRACSTPPALMQRCGICDLRETIRELEPEEPWPTNQAGERYPDYAESYRQTA